MPRENRGDVKALLLLVEQTVPAATIAIDHSERPDDQATPFETISTRETRELMRAIHLALLHSGLDEVEARQYLAAMEDFRDFPETLASLDETTPED